MHLNGSGLPSPALVLIIPPTNQILTTLSLLRSLFSELATITTRHHESPQAEAWQLMDFLYPKLLNHLAQNLMAIPPWPKHQAPAAKRPPRTTMVVTDLFLQLSVCVGIPCLYKISVQDIFVQRENGIVQMDVVFCVQNATMQYVCEKFVFKHANIDKTQKHLSMNMVIHKSQDKEDYMYHLRAWICQLASYKKKWKQMLPILI